MRRREVLSALCGALISSPSFTWAQPVELKRIGVLMAGRLPPLDTLRRSLQDLGYREDEAIRFEERFAEGSEQRYPTLAAELVASRADVIVTWGTPATLAAQRATSTIPIVMAAVGDPVSIGVAASLAHPGGNITGLSTFNAELESKRVDILMELVPGLTRVGVLTNATSGYALDAIQRLRRDAAARGLALHEAAVRDRSDLDGQLQALAQARPEAVIVVADSFLTAHHPRIAQAMTDHRLPAIYGYREAALGGGLMAYGPDYHELFRRAAGYVDKIIKGAKPGNLPIEQPIRFELVINLKTAQGLGLTVPPAFLARADEVIE